MSAAELGKRLMGEIEEERLDELLSSLRHLHDPASSLRLGVAPIDKLLGLSTSIPELHHGQHIAPLTHTHTITAGLPARKKTRSAPFIEITSPGPGDGKRHLLYHITAAAVLPTHVSGVPIQGQNGAIVVLDTDNRFSIPRLAEVMKHYLHVQVALATAAATAAATKTNTMANAPENRSTSELDAQHTPVSRHITPAVLETVMNTALQHIHIFRPQSLASLIATVDSLPAYLLGPSSASANNPSNMSSKSAPGPSTSSHVSADRAMRGILLSSASAFLWASRNDAANAALPTLADDAEVEQGRDSQSRTGNATYASLAKSLQQAAAALACPVVYTVHDYAIGSSANAAHGTGSTGLPPPWPSLPVLRLSIARRAVRKFAPGASAEEAVRDASERGEVVRRGWFDVVALEGVNVRGGIGDGAREALGRELLGSGRRGLGFEVKITRLGVEVVE